LRESFFYEGEDGAGLFGGGEIVCTYGTCAGDVDDVADADGAGEADDGFVGRGAGDVLAVCAHGDMIVVGLGV